MENRAVNQVPTETKKQSTKQKGYSIIELSIALAIISIILVGSLAGVQRVLRSNNLNNELKSAQLGMANLTTLLATTNSTSGISSAGAITLKLFDGLQVDATNNLYKNNFGGFIYAESNAVGIGANNANSGFIYSSTNIPPDICSDYLNGLASIPVLNRHGLQEKDLYDPCVNVLVAAWILSNNFQKLGYTTQGLGAYNAVTPWKRERYARQILQSFKY